MHYNWHRYYDPSTGRYLTPDPIGIVPYGPERGINHLYSYVQNDPVNFVDPEGLWAHIAGGAAGGAVGGAVVGAISGAAKAAVNGKSMALGAMKGALTGAAIGGVTGGLMMAGVPIAPMAQAAFSEGYLYGLWGTKLPGALSLFASVVTDVNEAHGSNPNPCP